MLELVPVTLREANGFVQQYHRHHKQVAGHKFSIGVAQDGKLVGVAICGRPVSRRLDNGTTLEVNRLCTDGTRNACSILYAQRRELRVIWDIKRSSPTFWRVSRAFRCGLRALPVRARLVGWNGTAGASLKQKISTHMK